MTAFADALDCLYEDDNLAVDATYRIGGAGAGVTVRLIFAKAKRELPFLETGAVVHDIVGAVRLSEAPGVKRGDTFEIAAPDANAGTYKVESAERDSKGIESRLQFSRVT